MQIIKFTKQKNGMYLLELDNRFKIKVHEDLILKYNLLITKEISETTLEEISNENKVYEIYEIALKYINTRLRSIRELKEYLLKKEYPLCDIEKIINRLKEQGYLNDNVYANSYVHDRILLSSDGPLKIKNYLTNQLISEDIVERALETFTIELEKERINKIVDKQIKTNSNKGASLLKKKIMMYLISLGYTYELVLECVNDKTLTSPDIYKKEYEKEYKKLSKKYSGKELEYRLKQKMYQKGFNQSEFE